MMNGETTDNLNRMSEENVNPVGERSQSGNIFAAPKPDSPQENVNPVGERSQNGNIFAAPKPDKPEKPFYELVKRDIIFSVTAVIFCLAFVWLALYGNFKIGFTLTYLPIFGLLSVYLFRKERRITGYGCLCGLLSVIGSCVFGYSVSGSVNFWLFLCIFGTSAVWFASVCGRREGLSDYALIGHIFSTVFGNTFGYFGKACRSFFKGNSNKTSRFGYAVLGVICAVPVAVIVIILLVSADAAFSALLANIGDNLGELIWKLLIGLLLACLFISYGFSLRYDEVSGRQKNPSKKLSVAFAAPFLCMISLVYIVYLFSQLAYFTDAFNGILPDGFTFADYARRGFFEITAIAAINLIIIFSALTLTGNRAERPHKLISAICTFIAVFTLLLIASAFAKMAMYIGTYGMTSPRIMTSSFLLLLGILFIAVCVRCYVSKTPVLRIALVSSTCILILLGFLNVEGFVSEYNVYAYKNGMLPTVHIETIEYYELNGVPALDKLAQDSDSELAEEAKSVLHALADAYLNETDEADFSVSELGNRCISDSRALKILQKYK